MGLFGKKKDKAIPVQFYEGNLTGFSCNYPCRIVLEDNHLLITKIKPDAEVRLERARILGIDIFHYENEYMAKYKGVNISTSKSNIVTKQYYVVRYTDKNGSENHLDFWGTSGETIKVMKMKQELEKDQESMSYEI